MFACTNGKGLNVLPANWTRLLARSGLPSDVPSAEPPADGPRHEIGPRPYIYGYVRVSDFERQPNSDKVQQEQIDKRAAHGDIPGTYVGCLVDHISSKRVNFADRTGGRWLWHNVRPGDSIIVTKMDRFGRTLVDMCRTITELNDRGAAIYILNHGGAPLAVDSTVGRAMIGFLATSAQFENDLRADRVRETIAYRKANGLVYCAQVPLGKRLARDEHGKKVWVRDDGQCAILMEMYRMHEIEGVPMNRIAQMLHQREVRDQNGNPWTWRNCNRRWSTKKIRKAIQFVAETLAAGRQL